MKATLRWRSVRWQVTTFVLGALCLVAAPLGAQAQQSGWRIQILAADEETMARDAALRVHQALGHSHPVYVVRRGRYHAVRVGDFASTRSAQDLLRELRAMGFADAWIAKNDPAATSLSIAAGAQSSSANGSTDTRTAVPPAASDSGSAATQPTVALAAQAPTANRVAGPANAEGKANAAPAPKPSDMASSAGSVRSLRALPSASAIRVDGRLDDAVWREAVFASDFKQKGKDRGFDPAERTEVAFAFDDEALYVGARMAVSDMATMRTLVSRRDDPGNVERLLVSLDTYRDRRTAYTFGVTLGGARLDYYQARDNEGWKDDSFDPVWDARVTVDSAGWNAEMRIPFSQLRFEDAEAPVWGLNIRRWNPATFLNVYWIVVPYYETGWSSRFGTLEGLGRVKGSGRVEVVPYAVMGATIPDATLRADGALRETSARGGGDLKVALASNVTLDATINPDFGQVEADPADVNLSAYETFFPEKRPFFLEGRELFRSRGPNLFYSRRIGSIPSGTMPGGVDGPTNATILGAVKATGRLPSGLSIGGLAAVTASERVVMPGVDGSPASSVAIAPTTAFGVARLNREFGSAGSNIGLIITGVERGVDPAGATGEVLTRRALAALSDWNLRFGGGTYELSGYGGLSYAAGSQESISRVQTSSAHFFQRPDAHHVEFDPARTSLAGWSAGASLAKYGGSNWFWDAAASAQSPGFEIRDLGSQTSADRIDASAGIRYSQRGATGPFQAFTLGAMASTGWDFGGNRQYLSPALFADLTWPNLWRSYLEVGYSTRALSSSLTRGGPLMGSPSSIRFSGSVSSSTVPRTQWFANSEVFIDELGGWSARLDGGVSMLPGQRLRLSINPGYSRATTARQYYDVVANGPAATFGSRYVFASLDRTELYVQLRAALAATPDLTLELYGEPFAANGRFFSFGELVAAGSHDIRIYSAYPGSEIRRESDGRLTVTDPDGTFSLANADFSIRSFRSNAVLRWEWRRGSTLYLIWQQNRWLYADRHGEVGPASLWRTIGDTGENILMAKLSYWLSF